MPCPAASIVYSPFTPANQTLYELTTSRTDPACWWWAICLFNRTDEARKLQFAATALVMGLVPLTLRDIAWPERRLVRLSAPLPLLLDIAVRALGLVPFLDHGRRGSPGGSPVGSPVLEFLVGRAAGPRGWKRAGAWAAGSGVLLAGMYGALVVMEVYSKRSALGCVVPSFVALWHVAAVGPATVEVLGTRAYGRLVECLRRGEEEKKGRRGAGEEDGERNTRSQEGGEEKTRVEGLGAGLGARGMSFVEANPASAIQGSGKPWIVQMAWAAYYVAATLIYSSIMAVTVVELVVWVVLSVATAAANKLVGILICKSVQRYRGLE